MIKADKQILFSVIIPAYNMADYLKDALDSIFNQNTKVDYEVIVVDDGSTDDTLKILKESAEKHPELSYFAQENQGAGKAKQVAASHAKGEYLITLDADDLLSPNYMSEIAKLIEAHPSYDIYASNALYFSGTQKKGNFHTEERFNQELSLTLDDMIASNQIFGNAAFSRKLFEEIGGFDLRFYNEDYALWLQLMLAGAKHFYTPKILGLYRQHDSQKTSDGLKIRKDDLAILESIKDDERLSEKQKELIALRIRSLKLTIALRKTSNAIIGPEASEKLIYKIRGRR